MAGSQHIHTRYLSFSLTWNQFYSCNIHPTFASIDKAPNLNYSHLTSNRIHYIKNATYHSHASLILLRLCRVWICQWQLECQPSRGLPLQTTPQIHQPTTPETRASRYPEMVHHNVASPLSNNSVRSHWSCNQRHGIETRRTNQATNRPHLPGK